MYLVGIPWRFAVNRSLITDLRAEGRDSAKEQFPLLLTARLHRVLGGPLSLRSVIGRNYVQRIARGRQVSLVTLMVK